VAPALPRREQASTLEQRDEARASLRAGASIEELACRYDQPWPVVRRWVNGRG
jgi:hypothetical protein